MKQIRNNIFEINSSSTHSLTVVTDEKFEQWKNSKIIYLKYDNSFLKVTPSLLCLIEAYNDETISDDKYIFLVNAFKKEHKRADLDEDFIECLQTYEEFLEFGNCYMKYTGKSGDIIHIFSQEEYTY